MRILFLDIETSPNIAHTWGIWNVNVGIDQIVKPGEVLCWAAKWHHSKEMYYMSRQDGRQAMLVGIHELLHEADAVVTYNGKKFDIPWLMGEFAVEGMLPPAPFKQIDLLETTKKVFRFPSNKLQYVSRVLKIGEKVKTGGHELWTKVMAGDEAAWKKFEHYNKRDVLLLERAYKRILPYIKGHPSHGTYLQEGKIVCYKCGSEHLQQRGFAYTQVNRYKRYQCMSCFSWNRGNANSYTGTNRRTIMRADLG